MSEWSLEILQQIPITQTLYAPLKCSFHCILLKSRECFDFPRNQLYLMYILDLIHSSIRTHTSGKCISNIRLSNKDPSYRIVFQIYLPFTLYTDGMQQSSRYHHHHLKPNFWQTDSHKYETACARLQIVVFSTILAVFCGIDQILMVNDCVV